MSDEYRKAVEDANETRKDLIGVAQEIERIELSRANRENEIMFGIITAVHKDGKAVYSNDTKRGNALSRELRNNLEYRKICETLTQLVQRKKTLEAKLSYNMDLQRMFYAIYIGSSMR